VGVVAELKPHQFNKSLDRGLQVLDLFKRDIPSLSAKEIAEKLGVGATTLYPFLHTLASHGYLEVDEQKRYRLGLKLLERVGELNKVYDVRSVARRELVTLSRKISANARLAVLYGNEVLYLDQEEGGPAANIILREVVGLRVPCYCTALGKVLLAYLPPQDTDAIIDSLDFVPFTDNTIRSAGRLREELDVVRQRGYSTEIEELQLGGGCVGAPIRNSTGRVIAAISASFLASRAHGKELDEIVKTILGVAADISVQLGFNGANSL
jgi:IclR family KDG regulon transcriptional repressor